MLRLEPLGPEPDELTYTNRLVLASFLCRTGASHEETRLLAARDLPAGS